MIRDIAETIAAVVGYAGETHWDATKPDGTPQKVLDVSKLAQSGWTSKIGLQEGLERTVTWYRDHVGALRAN
jgi:GDP-L-fucose synthase